MQVRAGSGESGSRPTPVYHRLRPSLRRNVKARSGLRLLRSAPLGGVENGSEPELFYSGRLCRPNKFAQRDEAASRTPQRAAQEGIRAAECSRPRASHQIHGWRSKIRTCCWTAEPRATNLGGMTQHRFRLYVQRIDTTKNMARFYAMSIEPDLFGGSALVRRWGSRRYSRPGAYRFVYG